MDEDLEAARRAASSPQDWLRVAHALVRAGRHADVAEIVPRIELVERAPLLDAIAPDLEGLSTFALARPTAIAPVDWADERTLVTFDDRNRVVLLHVDEGRTELLAEIPRTELRLPAAIAVDATHVLVAFTRNVYVVDRATHEVSELGKAHRRVDGVALAHGCAFVQESLFPSRVRAFELDGKIRWSLTTKGAIQSHASLDASRAVVQHTLDVEKKPIVSLHDPFAKTPRATFDLDEHAPVLAIERSDSPFAFAMQATVSACGLRVLVATRTLALFDARGKLLHALGGPPYPELGDPTPSPSGRLVAGGVEKGLQVIDLATKRSRVFELAEPIAAAWSPSGRRLAVVGRREVTVIGS